MIRKCLEQGPAFCETVEALAITAITFCLCPGKSLPAAPPFLEVTTSNRDLIFPLSQVPEPEGPESIPTSWSS